jgi:hypothetical protein
VRFVEGKDRDRYYRTFGLFKIDRLTNNSGR